MCNDDWGLKPGWNYTLDFYGGITDDEFLGYSNIFFSQGTLDPWRGGGPSETISEERNLIGLTMDECAHHVDLRLPNPTTDPDSVVAGRNLERDFINKVIGK